MKNRILSRRETTPKSQSDGRRNGVKGMRKSFAVESRQGVDRVTLLWDACVAVGYAGRNQESVAAHVRELAELGVPVPSRIPSMYWIDPERITDGSELFVVGDETSGEVEFFLASDEAGRWYVALASDHTDRKLEAVSVSKAKQICTKAVSSTVWPLDELEDHWDDLILESRVADGNEPFSEYQRGRTGLLLPPETLLALSKEDLPYEATRFALFSGTIPLSAKETRFASRWELLLSDPVLGRELRGAYRVRVLPDRN
jgi:hypothetical protein